MRPRLPAPSALAAAALYAGAAALVLFPALLNGFPLVMGDTWRYVRESGGEYSWASSHFYGYLLRLVEGTTLWVVVAVQALALVLVVAAFVRRAAGASHLAAALVVGILALTSSASFFASLVMTDVWLGIGVVAAVALVLARAWRRTDALLVLAVAFATAVHPVALALYGLLALAAVLVLAVVRLTRGTWWRPARVGLLAAGIATGVGALTVSNAVVWGKPTPNPHSSVSTFAYLYVHGDLAKQLERCERWDVCALPPVPPRPDRPELFPFGGEKLDEFNWFLFDDDSSLLWREYGGPTEFAPTARAIVLAHVRAEPDSLARRVASAGWEQLFEIRGLTHLEWMTQYLGARHLALLATHNRGDPPRFEAGRQFGRDLDLGWASDVARTFTILGALAVAGAAGAGLVRRDVRTHPAVAASLLLLGVYVAHAFVVATSAVPTPRYGGRVSWLLVLALWTLAYAGARRLAGSRVDEDDVAEPAHGDTDVAHARGRTGGARERG